MKFKVIDFKGRRVKTYEVSSITEARKQFGKDGFKKNAHGHYSLVQGEQMKYFTLDGNWVENFDSNHGYQVGDTVDELTLEHVVELPKEGATVFFTKLDNEDPSSKYQYILAYGADLAMGNASFDSLEEAIDEYEKEDGWIESDDSCRQKFKKLDENRFLYKEDRITNPETGEKYVYESLMDFEDYTEDDLEKGVEAYYKNLDEVKRIYGDDWKQIVLECIFEQESL